MLKSDLLDLANLQHTEIIRFTLKGDALNLLVVGDNEEDSAHDHHDDEDGHDCCDGLNGHLFMLTFKGVKNFTTKGDECDNYKTIKVEHDVNHLSLELEGFNFTDDGNLLTMGFDFESFTVADKGEIEGPDA
jgi:hypothetical protein